MPDRDTVVNRMETICNICKENTWRTELSSDIIYPLLSDALALIKEQEDLGTELTNAVELIHKKNERIEKLLKEQEAIPLQYSETREEYWHYESICPKCGNRWISIGEDHFCPCCGQAVKEGDPDA